MDSWALNGLSASQIAVLNRGNLSNPVDILLTSAQEIGRTCKISVMEAQDIIDAMYSDAPRPQIRPLNDIERDIELCTTGDPVLDEILGGGIRPGMIWELAGERSFLSAAGKTQLALQLSLFVQLPETQKGLSGSACYITTSTTLPTARLLQIKKSNLSLSQSDCDLQNVHTLSTPTIPHLVRVLSESLPSFVNDRKKNGLKPVKLLVIDALAELFHCFDKTTTNSLVERSRNITHISFLLHNIAKRHGLGIIVVNEVIDAIDRSGGNDNNTEGLLYGDQSRWFSRGYNVPGENAKEVSLGMVWTNQVNARILLIRTGRRRYLDDSESAKRVKTQTDTPARSDASTTGDLTLIRRLNLVFSCLSRPASLDYIVTKAGIRVLSKAGLNSLIEDENARSATENRLLPPVPTDVAEILRPLGVTAFENIEMYDGSSSLEDEWDGYWASNIISQVELDALDSTSGL
ncbi:hypothetical protein H0H92_013947 [Tricholoma furcatifolium]|nr:hypothetical protein H0H92_013947 [Tricholoma furcatifolium]